MRSRTTIDNAFVPRTESTPAVLQTLFHNGGATRFDTPTHKHTDDTPTPSMARAPVAAARQGHKRPSPSLRSEAPPIVHALGGSIGSALALLLLYPLERARIELQSRAGSSLSSSCSSSSSLSESQKGLVATTEPISPIRHAGEGASEGESSWEGASPDTPSSWSVHSGSNDSRDSSGSYTEDGSQGGPGPSYGEADGILRCLLDLRDRGVLYKGVKPIVSTIFTSQFVFFFLHAYAKRWLARVTNSGSVSNSPSLSLLSSCLAGVGNVLLTNPLWVTNMAIVSGTTETQNLFREVLRLSRDHGLGHLWKGTGASLLLVSNPILQFVCYEQFKRKILEGRGKTGPGGKARTTLGAAEAFAVAALAKTIATVGTYPLQLAQTLLRLADGDRSGERAARYEGTIDCLARLYRTNGAGCAAWFKGMRAKLLQTVLTAAFTFLTYEQILGAVRRVVESHALRVRTSRRRVGTTGGSSGGNGLDQLLE
ncbi:unnamed protein product [Pseudo-nitzschia multistriata]|uniref:Uncharacterized protein n=1 Tax=Pseudo-nitzschia multistriata TaxID=183589 RepID=A0A448ZMJ4_9STRA|nr:unnamed protein product [Pseudo-nitzschia multistriata]